MLKRMHSGAGTEFEANMTLANTWGLQKVRQKVQMAKWAQSNAPISSNIADLTAIDKVQPKNAPS